MSKFLLVTSLLFMFGLVTGNKVFANFKNTAGININSLPVTYKDSSFIQPSTVFTQGELIHVKFNSSSDGSLLSKVVLMDNHKNEIKKLEITKRGNQLYQYTAVFNAPDLDGQYYLSINLKSKGNSFSYQQNIKITAGVKDDKLIIRNDDNSGNIAEESILTGLLNKLKISFQKIKFRIINRA